MIRQLMLEMGALGEVLLFTPDPPPLDGIGGGQRANGVEGTRETEQPHQSTDDLLARLDAAERLPGASELRSLSYDLLGVSPAVGVDLRIAGRTNCRWRAHR
ncbi:hypothetical protein ABZ915_23620 [Streptomyces sp. NPDC046915]|uniref:hypothetical protein n=1 Tax=Streptomyces sp. NPDC046915 TaxID=3155257 RepID=UPI0033C7F737